MGDSMDLSAMAAIGSVAMTAAGYLYLHGRQSKAADATEKGLAEVVHKTEKNANDLADFKEKAAGTFVTRGHIEQMENRLLGRMDTQDARSEANLNSIRALIENFLFVRPKDHG